MFEEGIWLYSHGVPHWNPKKFSYVKLSGPGIDQTRTEEVGNILGRKLQSINSNGYQVELIAGIPHPSMPEVAFVESLAKDYPKVVGVEFRLVLSGLNLREVSWEIKSYNPFFGCSVRFLDWFENKVLFIYREKHDTYICMFCRQHPFYRFWKKHTVAWTKIGDMWTINGDRLGYWDKKWSKVGVIRLPSLDRLPPLTLEAAEREGLKPENC